MIGYNGSWLGTHDSPNDVKLRRGQAARSVPGFRRLKAEDMIKNVKPQSSPFLRMMAGKR